MQISIAAITGVVLSALVSGIAAPAALAHDEAFRRSVTVQGNGEVTARSDEARVSLGVVAQAETAAAALAENNRRMDKVFAQLRASGLAERDIATRALRITPVYQAKRPARAREGSSPPAIIGYRVWNGIVVRVRDLAKLGGLLDRLIAEGANRLDGIGFSVGETDALADRARGLAIADARRKAALYAKATGAALGPVLTIAENGPSRPRPVQFRAARLEAAGNVPIAGGEQTIRIAVTVTFALQ